MAGSLWHGPPAAPTSLTYVLSKLHSQLLEPVKGLLGRLSLVEQRFQLVVQPSYQALAHGGHDARVGLLQGKRRREHQLSAHQQHSVELQCKGPFAAAASCSITSAPRRPPPPAAAAAAGAGAWPPCLPW